MQDFEYRVSVIVPIYNVEKYLSACLDSLINQTMEYSDMEILLIDDGSTDNSYNIAESYADIFPVFKLFSKENEGFSATRNYGITHAKGKYIMYLDSDDMFTPETIKSVVDFFDAVYDEVDLVTYKIVSFLNGKRQPLHFRYKYLTKTGIYDLNEVPYSIQTTMNIAVKNILDGNVLFLRDNKVGHEDLQYCNKIVSKEMKIGYCAKGEYIYNCSNETSVMHEKFYPIYIFDETINYYENLFNEYGGGVPVYYQAMFMNDLSWKLKKNILIPYHLTGEKYNDALKRMSALIDRIDDEIIMTCPSTDNFHRHFFINWKSDKGKCCVVADSQSVSVFKGDRRLICQEKLEVCLYRLRVQRENIYMLGFVKSTIFNYMEKPEVYVVINTIDNKTERIKLELELSGESYYHTRELTNHFWQFIFEYPIESISSYKLEVDMEGFSYPTYYWFASTAPYSLKQKKYRAIYKNDVIGFDRNIFYVSHKSKEEIENIRMEETRKYAGVKSIYAIRYAADQKCDQRVWLYYDCIGVKEDNGWFQFEHDFEKKDGILRYFINANKGAEFDDKYKGRIVNFGSINHKVLYVIAEKIITAYVESENIVPFEKTERAYISDIAHAQVIYLQHGILHAHLPWKYSPGRIEADKIVVSSEFEKRNFVQIYKFREQDLVPVGMERFDFMDRNKKPVQRILFAPSWRNYLIGSKIGNEWNYTEERFVKSDYFRIFNEFINDSRLEQILNQNNIYMDFKLHPIFRPYLKYFDNRNEHVSFAEEKVKDDDYIMYITDFSSYVFNFAYLGRTIMYFVPDWNQFVSGMNQYRELDLPFEDAFGPLVKDVDSAIEQIALAVEQGFMPEKIYVERMENFYLPMENNREAMYRYLMDL